MLLLLPSPAGLAGEAGQQAPLSLQAGPSLPSQPRAASCLDISGMEVADSDPSSLDVNLKRFVCWAASCFVAGLPLSLPLSSWCTKCC